MGKVRHFDDVTVDAKHVTGVSAHMKPCTSVDIKRSIGKNELLHIQGRIITPKTEAARYFETSVYVYQTMRVAYKKSEMFIDDLLAIVYYPVSLPLILISCLYKYIIADIRFCCKDASQVISCVDLAVS